MVTTETSVTLQVAAGELVVKRRDSSSPWEIAMYRRSCMTGSPLVFGMQMHTAELSPHHFEERTFATPQKAAEAIRRLLAAKGVMLN